MTYNPNRFLVKPKYANISVAESDTEADMSELENCSHVVYSVIANAPDAPLKLARTGDNFAGVYNKTATFINTGTNSFEITIDGSSKHADFNHPSGNIIVSANQHVTILFSSDGHAITERSTISTT